MLVFANNIIKKTPNEKLRHWDLVKLSVKLDEIES